MRNMSFALTTEQIRARTKTVTRRKGTWWASVLKPGTLLCAVEKSQGIQKGGLGRLCVIRVVSVLTEPLDEISEECSLCPDERERELGYACAGPLSEGFPVMSCGEFVGMFRKHMGGSSDQIVTRIEFEYVEDGTS